MKVAVIHRINDPKGYEEARRNAMTQGLPDGFACPVQASTSDGRTEICIWDAPSAKALQTMLEPLASQFAVNEYHEVSVEGLS